MEWPTIEVRWFFAGACPAEVAQWFHGGTRVSDVECRTDDYAPLDRDDLGIKKRGGGALDVKVRTARLSDPGLPAGFEGNVEAWTKWSFPLDPAAPPSVQWRPVDKMRWTRRYHVDDGVTRPIDLDQMVAAGCSAELAFLRRGSVEAWTFGFEAFNVEGDRLGPLVIGVRAFVEETPPGALRFGTGASCGYPGWLRTFG